MAGDDKASGGRSCCEDETQACEQQEAQAGLCPKCGERGKAVDGQTVKSLLAISLLHTSHEPYLFCSTPGCPVVYYSGDGAQSFGAHEVRERVYAKEPESDAVPICYCFRYTPGSIKQELRATGRSTAVEEITAGTQGGYCACDIRNPKGSCCLGDVRMLVKRLQAEGAAPDR